MTDRDQQTGAPAPAAARRVFWQRVTIIVAVLLVGLILGVATLHYFPASGGARYEAPEWSYRFGLGLAGLGVVLAVVGGVRAWRGGALRPAWKRPISALAKPERRRLLQQIRGDRVVRPEQAASAVDLARRIARTGAVVPFYGGLIMLYVGQAMASSVPVFVRAPLLIGSGVLVVAMVLMFRDARLARRWLEHHGTETGDVSGSAPTP